MKKRLAMASGALVALILAGCGTNVNNTANPGADVMNATQRAANRTVNAPQTNRDVHLATKIANGLVRQGYADHAFAFVVGNTAYVAIDQKGPGKTNLGLPQKNKMANAVRRIDHRIKTVYVSANPDTYQRFKSFADDLQAGKPVSAIWDNFRTTVARVFPTSH